MDNLQLKPFNVDSDITMVSTRWQKWLRAFEYLIVGRDITKPEQKKALLLHLAGGEVQDIFETLGDTQDEEVDPYQDAIDKLNEYFIPQKNLTYERHIFRSIKQGHNEAIDQFVTKLRQQAKFCDFMDIEDQIKDQIVDGCIDSDLRKKILEKGDNVKLPEVLKIAQAREISNQQIKSFSEVSVNKVHPLTVQQEKI